MNNEKTRDPGVCPNCGSGDLEGSSWDLIGNVASQNVTCNECGAYWTDNYAYSDFIHLELPEPKHQTIERTFTTHEAARAFIEGVRYVNDSSIGRIFLMQPDTNEWLVSIEDKDT